MPAAMVLDLLPSEPLRLDRLHGKALHGLAFQLLTEIAPDLSARLHDSGDLKPFSVSPLVGLNSWTPLQQVREGQACRMRLTLLDEQLAQKLSTWFLETRQELKILETSWTVARLSLTPRSSEPWASVDTLQSLSSRTPEERHIEMEFVTPTTFRQGDIDLPLPVPSLVFGSLLKRAVHFFPQFIPPEEGRQLTATLGELVAVARHQIQTERAIETGFVGTVCFEIAKGAPRPTSILINFLAELAFYLGVGRKTTMGMGMSRRVLCRGNRKGRDSAAAWP